MLIANMGVTLKLLAIHNQFLRVRAMNKFYQLAIGFVLVPMFTNSYAAKLEKCETSKHIIEKVINDKVPWEKQNLELLIQCGGEQLSAELKQRVVLEVLKIASTDLLTKLVDSGFDLDFARNDGVTPIMIAIQKGNLTMTSLLIEAGASLTTQAPNGYAAFDIALELGHINILKTIVNQHLKVVDNDTNVSSLSSIKAPHIQSLLLIYAIIENDQKSLEDLIKQGMNINTHNITNYAPLPLAVRLGHTEIVSLLLKHHANPNIGNDGNDQAIPLNQAARSNSLQLAQILLDAGANINKENGRGYSALMLASLYGHEQFVDFLIENKANIHHTNHKGSDALMMASAYGQNAIASKLLSIGVDSSRENSKGFTALDYAVQQGSKEIVASFLHHHGFKTAAKILFSENVTELNIDTQFISAKFLGYPLLNLSARFGNVALTRKLLSLGANPTVQSSTGYKKNALMAACQGGSLLLVEAIISHGIDVNIQDSHGDPAINWATAYNQKDIVSTLLSAGADPNVSNVDGYTAFRTAKEKGLKEITDLLNAYAQNLKAQEVSKNG